MQNPEPRSSKSFHLGALIGWTKHSSILLGGFFLVILLILYIWWPLAVDALAIVDWAGPWWLYMDWLLIGIFFFMSLAIMTRANLMVDALIIFVGTLGGLVIESWGTQTNLWFYYTAERPPLWIIPAWPIASLAIDRITCLMDSIITRIENRHIPCGPKNPGSSKFLKGLYWIIFLVFFILMLVFIAPTFTKSYTVIATLLVILLIATPTDLRMAVLTFLAGSALGYFLELWGTTRQCWTYYTYQTPPLFAVLAHGMAAVAFWRAGLLVKLVWRKLFSRSQLQRDRQNV